MFWECWATACYVLQPTDSSATPAQTAPAPTATSKRKQRNQHVWPRKDAVLEQITELISELDEMDTEIAKQVLHSRAYTVSQPTCPPLYGLGCALLLCAYSLYKKHASGAKLLAPLLSVVAPALCGDRPACLLGQV